MNPLWLRSLLASIVFLIVLAIIGGLIALTSGHILWVVGFLVVWGCLHAFMSMASNDLDDDDDDEDL